MEEHATAVACYIRHRTLYAEAAKTFPSHNRNLMANTTNFQFLLKQTVFSLSFLKLVTFDFPFSKLLTIKGYQSIITETSQRTS